MWPVIIDQVPIGKPCTDRMKTDRINPVPSRTVYHFVQTVFAFAKIWKQDVKRDWIDRDPDRDRKQDEFFSVHICRIPFLTFQLYEDNLLACFLNIGLLRPIWLPVPYFARKPATASANFSRLCFKKKRITCWCVWPWPMWHAALLYRRTAHKLQYRRRLVCNFWGALLIHLFTLLQRIYLLTLIYVCEFMWHVIPV